MTVADLDLARAEREDDCRRTTPEQLLKLVGRDIGAARMKGFAVDKVLIVVERRFADGSLEIDTYRCGLNRYEEIGLFEVALAERVEAFRK